MKSSDLSFTHERGSARLHAQEFTQSLEPGPKNDQLSLRWQIDRGDKKQRRLERFGLDFLGTSQPLAATVRVIGVNMWMWLEWVVSHSPVNSGIVNSEHEIDSVKKCPWMNAPKTCRNSMWMEKSEWWPLSPHPYAQPQESFKFFVALLVYWRLFLKTLRKYRKIH